MKVQEALKAAIEALNYVDNRAGLVPHIAYEKISTTLNQCKSALSEQQKPLSEWQPIKTAPIQEPVLVAGGDCDYPCSAQWSGLHDEPWVVDGQMNTYNEIGWPTHWMPLPDAPTE